MNKKKELRLRLPFRILIVFLGVLVVVTSYYPIRSIYKLHNHKYSLDTSIDMYKDGIYSYVIDKEYSETLDKIYGEEGYNPDRIDDYMSIKYYDRDNFLNNINKLLDLGYKIDEINNIYAKTSDKFIEKLTSKYIYDIGKYLAIDYFKEENYDRYIEYFNGSYQKTVLHVNIGLDKDYYQDPNNVDKFSITMLVNKYNKLDKDFVPDDLVLIDSNYSDEEIYLNKQAADAFLEMCVAAEKEGLHMKANSGYRDYATQEKLYNYYLKLYGKSYNDKFVTLPGFSEHQTGLGVDIKSTSSKIFKNSKEYKWVLKNSYKYGFIHRFPESKVNITGIHSESWHFRYVGVETATKVYQQGLSYEEYYAMYLDK